jgi:pyruvate dehydrogenase E1 component
MRRSDGEGLQGLSSKEKQWEASADFILTMSPDVGTSTQLNPVIDNRVYGPTTDDRENVAHVEEKTGHHKKRPGLLPTTAPWTRHIRFEIAEANAMSAVGAFGRMGHYAGVLFFPIMTVYDFFIKRALDQLYYNLYWGAEFVIMGTPSGVTLSSEGAQHSWKSDIQIPNLITWEPLFAIEVDWILSDAIRRHMDDENEGRRGVLIRAVTRAVPQKLLLESVRTAKNCKIAGTVTGPLKPKGADASWGPDAVDESTLPPDPDEVLLERVRAACLKGAYYLVDWRGYAGYEPGDNVVHVFAMGSIVTEAIEASKVLLERGIFANVISVTSPELTLGILAEQDGYRHLADLGVTGDLHAVEGSGESEAGLLSLAGRRVPIVAVCDGEAGLLDNIGSVVGVRQKTLAVRKFSKCGRPDEVYAFQNIDCDSIVEACGQVLGETALEDLRISPELLQRIAQRQASPEPKRADWRALWPHA